MATLDRDWLRTLNPASFKGVPFQVEHDNEEGGRRVVIHEFPGRDDPFNEDLGAKRVEFDVTAYIASNNADGDAAALGAACAAGGIGILVLPMQGQISVKCIDYRRSREKTKAGYVAFTLKFVKEGASTALVSFASLANLIFAGAGAMVAAVSAYAQTAMVGLDQPDFVQDAATEALRDGAGALEMVRTTQGVDPIVSGAQRNAIQILHDEAPSAVTAGGVDGTAFGQLVTIARALADGMTPTVAIGAFEQIVTADFFVPQVIYYTGFAVNADANRKAAYLALQIAAATAYSEAIARADIADRQTAIALRANASEYFSGLIGQLSADDGAIYQALADLAGSVAEYLSRAILDRAPLITVAANRQMPATWWAQRLYQDAGRTQEIANRGAAVHPSFMPLEFEVLSR